MVLRAEIVLAGATPVRAATELLAAVVRLVGVWGRGRESSALKKEYVNGGERRVPRETKYETKRFSLFWNALIDW